MDKIFLKKIMSFFHYPFVTRYHIIEALLILSLAQLLLFLPLRCFTLFLGKLNQESSQDSFVDLQTIQSIKQAILIAKNNLPWQCKCLVQAITAGWMLKRRKVASTLYVGVTKNTSNKSSFAAHAWLRAGKFIVVGGENHTEFTIIARYMFR